MRTRLFHTVVLVGTALGASLSTVSCSSSDSAGQQCAGQSCDTFPGISYVGDTGRTDGWPGIGIDAPTDTWPGIRPADCDANPLLPGCGKDSGAETDGDGGSDSDSDTFPGIAVDTGPDTFPGIAPDGGTDTWPGISPAIDAHA